MQEMRGRFRRRRRGDRFRRGGRFRRRRRRFVVVVAVGVVVVVFVAVVAVGAVGAAGLGRAAAPRPRLAPPFSSRPRPSRPSCSRGLPSSSLAPPPQCLLGVTQPGLKNSTTKNNNNGKCADDPASFIYVCLPLARGSCPVTSSLGARRWQCNQKSQTDGWHAERRAAAHFKSNPID